MKVKWIWDDYVTCGGEVAKSILLPQCPNCDAAPTYNEPECPWCGVTLEYEGGGSDEW